MSDPHGTPESHSEQDHAPDTHGGMQLGPVDVRMWLVGVVGVAFALLVTAAFVAATGFTFLEYSVG